MFRIGAKVAYPGHGSGVIEALEKKTIRGVECQLFVVRLLENGHLFLVPAAQVTSESLRPPLSRATVSKVYHILRTPKPLGNSANWLRRFRSYPDKIKTGSLIETAKILRDLLTLRAEKTLSANENEMLNTAHDRLVHELASEQATSKEKILEELRVMFLLAVGKSTVPARS